ncbi:MAG TPA: hypothetical protein VKP65_10800 [Rhodothermales bacterium]|nr:hypothetical protein [Rhodothermales bacterium]
MANCTALPAFVRTRHVYRLALLGGVVLGCLVADFSVALAQPIHFGSADDPDEQIQEVWWRRESSLYAMGGVSLIASQWRGVGHVSAHIVRRSFTARLEGSFRAGVLGTYDPDTDEAYDLLRLVDFVRYEPPRTARFHLRVGRIERMRLGFGHVVNFFKSTVAWDERTIGTEIAWATDAMEISGFTDNVLLDGATAGRIALNPLSFTRSRRTNSLRLGFSYFTDLAPHDPVTPRLEAYNADAQFDLFTSGDISFSPFASYAWYPDFGNGLAFGADIYSNEFLDLLTFRLRMGVFYNSRQFIPGYVGTFYTVNNLQARIINSDENADSLGGAPLEGVALSESAGANDLLFELHLLSDDSFEFWYSFRRHYGAQRLSELHFRAYLKAAPRLRLEVGIDRGGLSSFFTIFSDINDQSALVFGTDYQITPPFFLFLRALYSYERVDNDDRHAQRYLVQRRFEPMAGIRLRF